MVYSKTYCPWSKRLKAILANYEIDDMKIIELDRSNQTEEMQVGGLCCWIQISRFRRFWKNTPAAPQSHNFSSAESLLADMMRQKQLRRKESCDQCSRKPTPCKRAFPYVSPHRSSPFTQHPHCYRMFSHSKWLFRFTNRVPVPDNGAWVGLCMSLIVQSLLNFVPSSMSSLPSSFHITSGMQCNARSSLCPYFSASPLPGFRCLYVEWNFFVELIFRKMRKWNEQNAKQVTTSQISNPPLLLPTSRSFLFLGFPDFPWFVRHFLLLFSSSSASW